MNTIQRAIPALIIDAGLGITGFIVSVAWWRLAGRTVDNTVVSFLLKMWLGIAAFGALLTFVV